MIIRIATEGQYEVADRDLASLDELDNAAVVACEANDEERFHETFSQLLHLVRTSGKPVDDDDLRGSDLIFPPPDISLEEARETFSGDGLIPNT